MAFKGTLSRNFEKKRKVVIFPITSSGRVEKSQKTKKQFCLKYVFPCGFPIFGDKKGEKSKWFCFFP